MTHDPPLFIPFEQIGGETVVRKLATLFYDVMEKTEPELTAVHEQDSPGHVSLRTRENFSLFLIEWLGGPRLYTPVQGHPRLRMRHGHIAIGPELRDAWLRCMTRALDELLIQGDIRAFLDQRFRDVAHFLQNRTSSPA